MSSQTTNQAVSSTKPSNPSLNVIKAVARMKSGTNTQQKENDAASGTANGTDAKQAPSRPGYKITKTTCETCPQSADHRQQQDTDSSNEKDMCTRFKKDGTICGAALDGGATTVIVKD
ncbi:hypothetical protein MMC30_008068 [Trapelia coarctata]|nr:hypothetical protein [Trapelia coarctata]